MARNPIRIHELKKTIAYLVNQSTFTKKRYIFMLAAWLNGRDTRLLIKSHSVAMWKMSGVRVVQALVEAMFAMGRFRNHVPRKTNRENHVEFLVVACYCLRLSV